MKRGRQRKRKRQDPIALGTWILLALSLPACFIGLRGAVRQMPKAVESLLVLSVMSGSPSQTMELLEERFQPIAHTPQEKEDDPSLLPVIQEPERKETAPQPVTQPVLRPSREKKDPPEIPEEYRGPLLSKNMAGYEGGGFLAWGKGYLRNYTEMTPEAILEVLEQPSKVRATKTKEPQVLIFHTHATESYEPYDREYYDTRGTWRSTDNGQNMVAVGDALAAALEAKGIAVIHDDTQHDYPSYNGSYNRSAETVEGYLKKYPSIEVVLDVHRDATQSGDEIIKPVTEINGEKAAQVMIIAPCDDGTMNLPGWRENLRFAAALTDAVESRYPTLTRPIFFCYRKYNMHLSSGALLLEFGSHGNTLEEAEYTATLLGECLGDYLNRTMEK